VWILKTLLENIVDSKKEVRLGGGAKEMKVERRENRPCRISKAVRLGN
jgi:hypothetical protein